MPAAKPPPGEQDRLQSLQALDVLDSGAEPEFDALTQAAALVCGVPIALISLIDRDRQWFKANVGLAGVAETPRDAAFCAHAIFDDGILEVPDATRDDRFVDNPLVTGDPHIRFYAGAPLVLSRGARVGTLCVIDREPRRLDARQLQVLSLLAQAASKALESRYAGLRLLASELRERNVYESTPAMLHSADMDDRLVTVTDLWLATLGYSRSEVIGRRFTDFLTEASRHHATQTVLPAYRESGRCDKVFYQMVKKTGEVLDMCLSATLEGEASGRQSRSLAVLENVTERLNAERALVEERYRLNAIIEGTGAGTWEWDIQTGITRFSSRWCELLGYSWSELEPLGIEARISLAHPDELAQSRELLRRHFVGELPAHEHECRLRHHDGGWIWVRDRGRVTARSADGRAILMHGILEDISERKAQLAALLKSETLLNRIGEVAGVGGWEIDLASQGIWWSAQTCRIHGVEPGYCPKLEEAISFYAPEARPVIQAAVEQSMVSGQGWDLELPFIQASGRHIWVRAVGQAEFDNGRPVRLLGAFQDVTERHHLAAAAIENERFVRQVVDNVPALIAHIDPQGRYTMVNDPYTRWDNRPRNQLIGRTVEEVHGPEGYAALAPCLSQALAGHPAAFEVELLRGDEHRAMQVAYVPDEDKFGHVTGVFSMKTDITPLRRAEEHLRLVMESSPLGMFTRDMQGRLTFANAAWQRIAGLAPEQWRSASFQNVVHPEDSQSVQAALRTALGEGGIQTSEHRYVRPDGQVVWVRGHITILRHNGRPEGVVGTVEDITERRRIDAALAEKSEALSRSNEDLERFAYVASHDLQEPLRMVNSYGQLLMRRHHAQLSAEAQEFLGFMVDGGQRAQALIRDLLSLARLDSQTRPFETVSLQEVLDDTLRQLHATLTEAGAVVTHDTLPAVSGDARQLGQLLLNLVSNAVKFRGDAVPTVHIRVREDPGFWRVSVQDNGIGIEARYFKRIFVMFQRLHLRSAHEGTGIGLAICKRVVERHGGVIGVESQQGIGSTFFFTLPQVKPPAPTSPAAAAAGKLSASV
jgi:diguanylate cyclase